MTCSYFAKFMIVLQLDAMINQDEPHAGKFSGLSIPVDSVMKPYDMNATNWIRNILEDQPLTTSSSSSKTSSTSASSKKPNSLSYLRNLWADSGDAISILYAGTRALKADVTRTGQRDFVKGSIDDGLNSLTRYYLNNFTDGRKQDAYDLWSGKVKPDQMQHMLQTDRDLNLKTKHVKSPCITKDKGIGYFLPPFVVDKIDPLLQATKEFSNSGGMTNLGVSLPSISGILGFRSSPSSSAAVAKSKSEHLDVDGKPSTYIGFVLSAIKLYAPERVSNVIEFLFAFVSFLCVLVIVYIFKVKGQLLVNSPKLIGFEKSNSNLNLAEEANGTSSITSSKVHLVMQPLD